MELRFLKALPGPEYTTPHVRLLLGLGIVYGKHRAIEPDGAIALWLFRHPRHRQICLEIQVGRWLCRARLPRRHWLATFETDTMRFAESG